MEQQDPDCRDIGSVFHVADVSRPLHSVGKICDGNKEVLFTGSEATVVPAGSLSRFLGQLRTTARYKRQGGLYVAKMQAVDPKTKQDPKRPPPKISQNSAQGFVRQGSKV